jgi:hypothetical protein
MKTCRSESCENQKVGRSAYCGPCRNSIQRYGLSAPQRQKVLETQGGVCKICKTQIQFDGSRSQYSACIDHDHATGRIRGILCGNCNTWTGYLENKKIDLEDLKLYLRATDF